MIEVSCRVHVSVQHALHRGHDAGGADLADRSWTYGFGVFYTGWNNFSISVETTMK